ncbi:MAG: ATP-binding protein, partial [Sodaliphilus sp.]|nr:ATP-binding protein [Bacteroidales bacterium]MDY5539316.1 ATP-binding protein [Sodaliphilus sp.]
DHCVNLCEMKFCRGKYTITKAEREKIENRMQSFIAYSKTKSSIRLTMITSFGVEKNTNSGIIQNELTLEDLF